MTKHVTDLIFLVGLYLLLERLSAWSEGKYQPDWKGISGGLLVGYAVTRIVKGTL